MSKLPDAITRREVVYGRPKRPVDYLALGKAYHEAGRPTDALDAALRIEGDQAGHDALVAAVRDSALERGDFFVLNRIHAKSPLSEAQWKQGFEKAKATGKTRFALKFAKRLGDSAEVERLELELGLRVPEAPAEVGQVASLSVQATKVEAPKAEDSEAPKAEDSEAPKAEDAEAPKAEDAEATKDDDAGAPKTG